MADETDYDKIDENTFFSIRREDLKEDGEYFYVRANVAGLKRYAEELNKIAKEAESSTPQTKLKLPNNFWLKGDISLGYVEVVGDIPTAKEIISEPEQMYRPQSIWINIGCAVVAIFLITAIIIGIVTIFKWL
ncbi:hypothetical protein BH10BAC1_BH10BAC1_01660 [soil metagenome]